MKTSLFSVSTELLILQAIILILLLIIAWFVGRAWYKRQVTIRDQCPRCGGTAFHRTRRNFLDRILGIGLPIRRYRCENPLCRYSVLRNRQHSSPHSHA
jgi:hypothetical protein